MHGQAANFASELKRSGSAFVLGGGADFYEKICGQLMDLGMQEAKLFAGENLTLKDEQIFEATPESQKTGKPVISSPLCWNGAESADHYHTALRMKHSPAETFR